MENEMINSLIGKIIKIDRGGSESRIGKLMDVYDDYLVILTEDDGVVYYNSYHIKSLSESVKEEIDFNIVVPEDFEFKKAENFEGLLDSLTYQWVKINRGGPEKLEGVLSHVNKDSVTLINKEEIVRLSMFHIRNISYGLKIEQAEEDKSDNQSDIKREYRRDYQPSYQDSPQSEFEKQHVSQHVVRTSNVRKNEETKTNRYLKVTSKKTAIEDDLSEILSSMENFVRKFSKTNSY